MCLPEREPEIAKWLAIERAQKRSRQRRKAAFPAPSWGGLSFGVGVDDIVAEGVRDPEACQNPY